MSVSSAFLKYRDHYTSNIIVVVCTTTIYMFISLLQVAK